MAYKSKTLFLALGIVFFTSCKTKQTQGDGKNTTPIRGSLKQSGSSTDSIINLGSNREGSFSQDGRYFLYVSDDRESHKNSQIYEYDLDLGRERRITYQDGDCSRPLYYQARKRIIYTSTTDELKERPIQFFPELWREREKPSEIYLSDIGGNEIQRLTHQLGFQGFLSYVNSNDGNLLLVSKILKNSSIAILDPNSFSTKIAGKQVSEDIRFPLVSRTGEYYWLTQDSPESQPKLQKGKPGISAQTVAFPAADYQNLKWWNQSKEQVLFSAKLVGKQNYEVFFFDLKESCLIKVFSDETNLTDPDLSEATNKILFSRDLASGKKSIVIKELPTRLGTCEEFQAPNQAAR